MLLLRSYTKITFQQLPSEAYPNRRNELVFNFCHALEATSSWQELTDKATVTIPKNIYARDQDGRLQPLGGTNVNIGGFDTNIPLFLRGDRATIEMGYKYFDTPGRETLTSSVIFSGFITKVGSKKPITLSLEDNMYALKQVIAPNKVYKQSEYTLETILKELLKDTPYTVNVLTNTSLGDFRTQNETVAEVLARLRKDYHFESYFRGNELRCGALVYIEQDAIDAGKKIFAFQKNIIEDDLEYKRRDDVELSAVAYSINKKELTTTTAKGKKKTKRERLEVLVTFRAGKFVRTEKKQGEKANYAPNTAGERRTLYFWNVATVKELGDLAEQELTKYFYTGFSGRFTTFGVPYVKHGDNIDLLDEVLPERNGRYKVKRVEYSGGVDGQRQEIHLDYLITRLDSEGNAIGR